jgi:hypothetical protein
MLTGRGSEPFDVVKARESFEVTSARILIYGLDPLIAEQHGPEVGCVGPLTMHTTMGGKAEKNRRSQWLVRAPENGQLGNCI